MNARRQKQSRGYLTGWGWMVVIALLSPMVPTAPGIAQILRPEVRNEFLSSPLDDEPRDPLLPNPPVERPLSPLEQLALEQELDELALEAEQLAEAGDPEAASELWMREVRLRRLLGLEEELQAMRRVAQWLRDRGSTQQLQLLSARLNEIQAEFAVDNPADQAVLLDIAEIYAILGDVEAAAAIYRSLADNALATGDRNEYQTLLETLAELQSDWFYFDDAAFTYGELIQISQTDPERDDEIRYLRGRIYNLEQAQDLVAALENQQQLLKLYDENEILWSLIPPLQHDMAENFLALEQTETATEYLQASYTNAITQQQFDVAGQSIRSLADIYRSLERWQDVLYLLDQLIIVEQQAYNAYGIMEAFGQKGATYEQLSQPDEALAAYREGLILARHLSHQQDYFEAQIARLTDGEIPPEEPLPEGQIPLDPEQIPLDPEQIPLDPEQIPLDPEQIPLDPEQIPLDPEQIPLESE
jgi:hypothetical protein